MSLAKPAINWSHVTGKRQSETKHRSQQYETATEPSAILRCYPQVPEMPQHSVEPMGCNDNGNVNDSPASGTQGGPLRPGSTRGTCAPCVQHPGSIPTILHPSAQPNSVCRAIALAARSEANARSGRRSGRRARDSRLLPSSARAPNAVFPASKPKAIPLVRDERHL